MCEDIPIEAKTPEMVDEEVKKSISRTAIDTMSGEATGWNENLASVSEAVVKAEATPTKDWATMQKETIEVLKKKEEQKQFPDG
jgi:hypothetical protein